MKKLLISILALSCVSAQVPVKAIDLSSLSGFLVGGYNKVRNQFSVKTITAAAMCAGLGHIVANRFFGDAPIVRSGLTLSAAAIGFSLPWMYKTYIDWRISRKEKLSKAEREIISQLMDSVESCKARRDMLQNPDQSHQIFLTFVIRKIQAIVASRDSQLEAVDNVKMVTAITDFPEYQGNRIEEFGAETVQVLTQLSQAMEPGYEFLGKPERAIISDLSHFLGQILEDNEYKDMFKKYENYSDRWQAFLRNIHGFIRKKHDPNNSFNIARLLNITAEECPVIACTGAVCNRGSLEKLFGEQTGKVVDELHIAMTSLLRKVDSIEHS